MKNPHPPAQPLASPRANPKSNFLSVDVAPLTAKGTITCQFKDFLMCAQRDQRPGNACGSVARG